MEIVISVNYRRRPCPDSVYLYIERRMCVIIAVDRTQ